MKNQIISEQNLQLIPAKLSPAAAAKAKADTFARALKPTIDALRAEGIIKSSAIATALILRGAETARGGQWNTTLVLTWHGESQCLSLRRKRHDRIYEV